MNKAVLNTIVRVVLVTALAALVGYLVFLRGPLSERPAEQVGGAGAVAADSQTIAAARAAQAEVDVRERVRDAAKTAQVKDLTLTGPKERVRVRATGSFSQLRRLAAAIPGDVKLVDGQLRGEDALLSVIDLDIKASGSSSWRATMVVQRR